MRDTIDEKVHSLFNSLISRQSQTHLESGFFFLTSPARAKDDDTLAVALARLEFLKACSRDPANASQVWWRSGTPGVGNVGKRVDEGRRKLTKLLLDRHCRATESKLSAQRMHQSPVHIYSSFSTNFHSQQISRVSKKFPHNLLV